MIRVDFGPISETVYIDIIYVYETVARVTKLHKNTICHHRELEYYF
jgi:hypothetical protein